MKTHFKEQYSLTGEDIKAIWDDCYVVLDANILLNFYRCSKETSEDMFNILNAIKDKLWIPYQVVWEYFNNRRDVFYENWNAANTIKESFKSYIDKFYKEDSVKKILARNPFFKSEELKEIVNKSIEDVNNVLAKYEQEVKDFTFKDNILEKLTELLDGKVGDDMSQQDFESLYKEGKKRYNQKTPPGYNDDTNEKRACGDRFVYGDFINWHMIIEKSKADGKNIFFVSGDQKEDWYDIWKGKKIRPRPELIKEFRDKTGKDIVIYNQHSFMKYAKENIIDSTNDASIAEVKEVEIEEQRKVEQKWLKDFTALSADLGPQYSALPAYNASLIPDSFSVLNQVMGKSVFGIPQAKALATTIIDANNIQNALINPNVQAVLDSALKKDTTVASPLASIISGFNPEALAASTNWVENLSKSTLKIDQLEGWKHLLDRK